MSKILSRKSFFSLVFSCFALLIMAFLGCGSQSGYYENGESAGVQKRSGPKIKAPDFELTDLNGNDFALKDMKGKVVFLDFWATWCPPCIMSSPDVEKLHTDYKDKNVEVISISLDTTEDVVKRFVEKRNIQTRQALVGGSAVDVHYRVSGIPAFFVIDQEGYVVGQWSGYAPSIGQQWRNTIDQLLKS